MCLPSAACSVPSPAPSHSSCLVYSLVSVFFTWPKIERQKKFPCTYLSSSAFSLCVGFPLAMIPFPATWLFLCFSCLSRLGLFLVFSNPGLVPSIHAGQVSEHSVKGQAWSCPGPEGSAEEFRSWPRSRPVLPLLVLAWAWPWACMLLGFTVEQKCPAGAPRAAWGESVGGLSPVLSCWASGR